MGNSLGLEVGKAPLTSPTVATNRTIRNGVRHPAILEV